MSSFGLVKKLSRDEFQCKKRMDCKAQQNSNRGMEGGCGETYEEWWKRGAKFRREGIHRKEKQPRFQASHDQLFRGIRQNLTLLTASQRTSAWRRRKTLRNKNQTWQLGRYMYNFRISQWTHFCSLRARSALIIKMDYKQGACFFFRPPPLTALGPQTDNLTLKINGCFLFGYILQIIFFE